jgi:hypothetical protein
MSRREDIEAANAKQRKGYNMIDKGKRLVAEGGAENPGQLEWLSFLLKPFATSEYDGEQLVKGGIYLVTAAGMVIISAWASSEIPACMTCGGIPAALIGLLGMLHITTVGRRSGSSGS